MTDLIEPAFTDQAGQIFLMRFSMKDDDQQPTESGGEAVWRVAINVASVNALYELREPKDIDGSEISALSIGVQSASDVFPYRTARRRYDYLANILGTKLVHEATGVHQSFQQQMVYGWHHVERKAREYQRMIAALDFMPNSPTWTGAGTELGQLAACYVLRIEDDLTEGEFSIFQTMRVAAGIEQTGGGNGFSFGRTRPYLAIVKRSKGRASGPVGWLVMYDAAFGQIGQGGVRSGANMGVLPIWHPDVLTYEEGHPGWIEVKGKAGQEGFLANFNISLAITDGFFDAVEENDDWAFEFGGKVYEKRPARDVFRMIAENAWVRGDPGNLFIDRANRDNPSPTRYTLEATNPCGEQWLPPYGNCCLGHVNIGNFARDDRTFDWDGFANALRLGQNFLDDVVDANQYVPQFPQLQEMAYNERRIGLGGMGLADAMLKMGIRYGSKDGLDFASQVNEFMLFHAMRASVDRAKERGSFPWIDGSIYDPRLLERYGFGAEVQMGGCGGTEMEGKSVTFKLWERPEPLVPHDLDVGRPALAWGSLQNDMVEHGIRNSTLLTWAPTGTTSNVAGCEGSGCEPVFALIYTRIVVQGEEKVRIDYLSPLFQEALKRAWDRGEVQKIKIPSEYHDSVFVRATTFEGYLDFVLEEVKNNSGSCQDLWSVPKSVRDVFVVAADVDVDGHIWTQAVLQQFTDNAISKTINMPNEATVEDVERAYKKAHSLGCKGITIYRQGSRDFEILTTERSVGAALHPALDEGAEAQHDGYDILSDVIPMAIPDYAPVEGLPTRTYPISTPFGTLQVYITHREEEPDRPFDLRVSLGKSGSDKLADVETIGRLTSLLLRSRVPVAIVIDQLEGIGGQTQQGFGPNRVRSVADALGKLLRRVYLGGDYEPVVKMSVTETVREAPRRDGSMTCPKCGIASVVAEAGCMHCDPRLGGCGDYSRCD